jgi:hypothetical protein
VAEVWRRRAAAYAADLKGSLLHSLPLQRTFEELAGSGPEARKLFAAAVRANGPLLRQVAEDPVAGRKSYQARCRQLHALATGRGEVAKVPAGDLAALLLASAALRHDKTDWRQPTHVAHLFGAPALRAAVRDREKGKAVRRLLVAWARGRNVAELLSLQWFLCLVQSAELKEGLPVVRGLIRNERASPINLRALGVVVLGKVGGKGVAAELHKLWDDKAVLFTARDGPKARLGDQALAASVRLAGKEPKDFHLASMTVLLRAPGGWTVKLPLYWFTSDADRRAGLKKWQAEADKRN